MSEAIYRKLAKVLDTLPPGFPPTDSGVEIKILKRIFKPDEAELFCELRMTFETAAQIAQRTSRSLEGLEDKLNRMFSRGQIRRINLGKEKAFSLVPWASGLYELQLDNLDPEFAALIAEHSPHVGLSSLGYKPPIWQTLPIEKKIPYDQVVLPHQQVSAIIEKGKEFYVRKCICKTSQGLLGNPCSKPVEVCLVIDPYPEILGKDNMNSGRKITKKEAYEIINLAEKEGLVHMTANTESEHHFICNCCGCCCGAMRGAKALEAAKVLGVDTVFNTFYFAEINPELCTACGICQEERCQIDAIEEIDGNFQVNRKKCIGCGLCVTSCPSEAVRLVAKKPEETVKPLKDRKTFWAERARQRGVDYSKFQ